MPIPSALTVLIERLNQELNQIEQEASEGLTMARSVLLKFPENAFSLQMFAFLNNAIFFT